MSISLGVAEFIAVVSGWILFIPIFVLLIIYIKFTPANVFLRAWWGKKDIFHCAGKNQIGEFRLGKTTEPGWADVSGEPVNMTENSALLDKKSKTRIFFMFDEFAFTIPRDFAGIIQELREKGFVLNTFKDYDKMIKLVSDEKYINNYLETIEDEKEKENISETLYKLKEMVKDYNVELKTNKTYRLHDLGHMFPNNITPSNVRAKIINTEARLRKKLSMYSDSLKWIGVIAIAIFIISIGAVFLMKAVGDPNCPAVVCEFARTGIETITNNATQTQPPSSVGDIIKLP